MYLSCFFPDDLHKKRSSAAGFVLSRYGRIGECRRSDILRVSDGPSGHVRVRKGDDWEKLYIYLRCLYRVGGS